MSRRILRRFGTAILLAGLAVLLGGSEYEGCGTGERVDTGGTLPEGSGDSCLVDSDCPQIDMCIAMACVGRACVESGPAIDEDEDFFAPMPCGEDCDDSDPTVFPMATELCDGVDQDCDGRIDEGATGVRVVELMPDLRFAQLVAVGDAFLLVGVRIGPVEAAIAAVRVDASGTAGMPVELVTGLDTDVRALSVTPMAGGALVAYVAGPGEAQRLVINGTPAVTDGPAALGATVGVTALDALVHSGREHVLLDTEDVPPRRVLVRSGLPDLELAGSASPPALASDGALVAATSGAGEVRFFDPVSGDPAGMFDLPGAFATRGLGSGIGWVFTAYRDAFDHSLARVTPDMLLSPTSAPASDAGDTVELFGLGGELVVTRRGPMGVSVSVLNDDLESFVASFDPMDVSPIPGPAERVSAATNDAGLSALQLGYGSRSVIVFLDCTE